MFDLTRYTNAQQKAIAAYRANAESLEDVKFQGREHRAACSWELRHDCGWCRSLDITQGIYEQVSLKLRRRAIRQGIAPYALVMVYQEGFAAAQAKRPADA